MKEQAFYDYLAKENAKQDREREDHIMYKTYNVMVKEIRETFKFYFNIDQAFDTPKLTAITGRYEIDAIGFDTWLQVPDGVSTYTHIEQKYGQNARAFIYRLTHSRSYSWIKPSSIKELRLEYFGG